MPLESVGGAFGLSPGEAAFTAGVTTNIVLAPITPPLSKAASYIEVTGIIIGLATGAHPLVLACIKPLAHSQLEHALSQCFVDLITGPHSDGPQQDTHPMTMRDLPARPPAVPSSAGNLPTTQPMEPHGMVPSGQHQFSNASPNTRGEDTRNNPPWVCLGFVPKPPEDPDLPARGFGLTDDVLDTVRKAVVLPAGDDQFLSTLPAVLQRSTVSEVDISTAKMKNNLPGRQDFILRINGIGASAFTTKSSHSNYQHPGCRTERCEPPGVYCPCLCSVCRPFLCG